MILSNDEATARINMNKAVFDLYTCLDRKDNPQLCWRTVQPLATPSPVWQGFSFAAKENFCLLWDRLQPGLLTGQFTASTGKWAAEGGNVAKASAGGLVFMAWRNANSGEEHWDERKEVRTSGQPHLCLDGIRGSSHTTWLVYTKSWTMDPYESILHQTSTAEKSNVTLLTWWPLTILCQFKFFAIICFLNYMWILSKQKFHWLKKKKWVSSWNEISWNLNNWSFFLIWSGTSLNIS